MTETVASLLAGYRSGATTVTDTVDRAFARIAAANDPAIFIALRDHADVRADAARLDADGDPSLPLFGIPVAVKDNIDVAGLPTTAACPAFAYLPERDADAVARLKRAGAIIIGKTNLDQFATGLVGVRSPYGTPRNPLRADLVPGGSSSGSAVAVARGIVPLALGTDTAGSGRVPAGLNNIVGLKPSLGLIPTAGVVPACRSLDCVSVFALTVEDAVAALEVMAPEAANAGARALQPCGLTDPPPAPRIGVPRTADRLFFGDNRAEASFARAEEIAAALGATLVEIDLTPFFETARLLYEGPWVAERTAAVGDFIARERNNVHPVTRSIIERGNGKSAVDAFRGFYRLAELRAVALRALDGVSALMVPTVPAPCTLADIAADPIGPNSRLGTYTNFVNLLDLAGIAIPATLESDGTAYGITLLGPAGRDHELASLALAMHARTGLPLGALGVPLPAPAARQAAMRSGEIALAVVGAHLSGLPLNGELASHGGRFLRAAATAADYRLFALPGGQERPGLLRVADGAGSAIEVEVWGLDAAGFGAFVAAVPPPLSIGTVRLADGTTVKGFLAEAEGVAGARDISSYGGWRAFLADRAKA